MDEMTLTLNSPITEEQWDDITDVDFEHTNEITFHTKHGKIVKFVKASAQTTERTNKHTETHACDCISRQAAIDELERKKDKNAKGDIGGFYNTIIQNDIDALMQLPSAQPELQWIPCSERLPEEDGEYLVIYYTHSKYKPYAYDVLSFANDLYQIDEYDFPNKKGQNGWFYCDVEYGYCEDDGVFAWMPLPEPYREDKE